jgi:hypothetical protein
MAWVRCAYTAARAVHRRGGAAVAPFASGQAAAAAPVEVEVKFAPSAAAAAWLRDNSDVVGVLAMRDVYWDRPARGRAGAVMADAWPLAHRDMWLRQRNAAWELKVPAHTAVSAHPASPEQGRVSAAGAPSPPVDVYRELTAPREIADECAHVVLRAYDDAVDTSGVRDGPSLERWLRHCLDLQAAFTIDTLRRTHRAVFRGQPVTVVWDEVVYHTSSLAAGPAPLLTDADAVARLPAHQRYTVCEAEVMVGASGGHPAQLQPEVAIGDARELVAAFLQHMSAAGARAGGGGVRGKVLEYVARCQPDLYASLQRSGMIARKLGS